MARFSRRKVLKLALAGAAAGAAGVAFPYVSRALAKKETILLIVSDAMRADCIGKRIGARDVTPNLNRLAASGLYFSDAYSAAPHTKPSVASILTGMCPPGHGVESEMYTLPSCMTIPSFLAEQGFKTAAVVTNPYLAPEIGPASSNRSMGFGYNGPFDFYRAIEAADDKPVPEQMKKFQGFAKGETLNEFFFRFLQRTDIPLTKGSSNMFFYLHYMDSHQPWVTPEPVENITGIFHERRLLEKLGVDAVHKMDCDIVDKVLLRGESPSEEDKSYLRVIYYEAAALADYWIGELLSRCDRMKNLGRVSVIFTADHGDELFEHDALGHCKNLYNPSLRVPLILRRSDLGVRQVDDRVTNTAILPAIMSWFGRSMQSQLIRPLPVASAGLSNEVFASFYGLGKVILPGGRVAIETANDPGNEKFLFFDIDADPAEFSPISRDERAEQLLRQIQFHARKEAADMGVAKRFSTYAWQNPYVDEQNRKAEALVAELKLTAEESAVRKSLGDFLPESFKAGPHPIDVQPLTPDQARRLKALGYLN